MSGCIPVGVNDIQINTTNVTVNQSLIEEPIDVSIQDYTGELESYFLINVKGSGMLISDSMELSNNVTVNSTTGCVIDESIYIYNGISSFQALITDIAGNTITFTPIIDKDFIAGESYFDCGSTNIAVDGSVNPVIFSIKPPYNVSWDIEAISVNFIDNADMDASTFGSRTSLINGLLIRRSDGDYNNLFMIYNNNGLLLRGFDLLNIPKAPSGVYMFDFRLLFEKTYGSIIRLEGNLSDRLEIVVSDDLTSQTRIVSTISGHLIDEK